MTEKRCRDCKHWSKGRCPKVKIDRTGLMMRTHQEDGALPIFRPLPEFYCKYHEFRRDFYIVPGGEGNMHLEVHGHCYLIDARNYEELHKLCGYLAGYIERIEDD